MSQGELRPQLYAGHAELMTAFRSAVFTLHMAVTWREANDELTFATRIAVALDVALLRDARLDGPVVLIGVQAGDGDNAGRRLIPRNGPRASVGALPAIASISATASSRTVAAAAAIAACKDASGLKSFSAGTQPSGLQSNRLHNALKWLSACS